MQINPQTILDRMTNEDIAELKRIYSPTVVATPFSDALTDLTVTADGEIRCYGHRALDDEPNGVCYLHLQTATELGDGKGSLIKNLNMQAK